MKKDVIELINSSGRELGAIKEGSDELYVTQLLGEPKIAKLLAHYMSELLEPEVTCIAGRGTGGMPLAALVSQITGKSLTLYAEKLKDSQGSEIAAYIPTKDDFVAIIEDKIHNRKIRGVEKTINAIRQTGAKVVGVYAVAKEGELPKDIAGVHYKYLIDADEDLLMS